VANTWLEIPAHYEATCSEEVKDLDNCRDTEVAERGGKESGKKAHRSQGGEIWRKTSSSHILP